MGANPLVGVIYHWIGGLASASNFIPFRPIKRWSFEIYWIIQGFAAWIVAPYYHRPHLCAGRPQRTLRATPVSTLWHTMFWGAMWGIGGLTFGLAVRYLGIALGYAIALGFCTAFGTLMPPIFNGQILSILHQTGGRVILLGVAICVLAIAVNGLAGYSKEKEVPAEERAAIGERDFSFGKGLGVAIFAGIMSSCFAYGLSAGKGIAADRAATPSCARRARTSGRTFPSSLWCSSAALPLTFSGPSSLSCATIPQHSFWEHQESILSRQRPVDETVD